MILERVKRAVECDTIETNGSAINEQTLEVIRNAQRSWRHCINRSRFPRR